MVRDRLNVLGYDQRTAEQAFQEWISEELKQAIERMEKWQQNESGHRDLDHRDLMEKHYRSDVEILSELSPESWVEGLKLIHSSGLQPKYYSRYEGPHENS